MNDGNGFGSYVFCGTANPYPGSGWINCIADSNVLQINGNEIKVKKAVKLTIVATTTSAGAGGDFKVYRNGSAIINMSFITGYSPSGSNSSAFNANINDTIKVSEGTENGYARPFCVRIYAS